MASASLFNIGTSALTATQRVLSTIGHNIANANTEGYARQKVDLSARSPDAIGGTFIGRGVEATQVMRVVDGFLDGQLRAAATGLGNAEAMHEFAVRLTDLIGDSSAGLQPALTSFFNAFQDLAADPGSLPTRQTVLGAAQTLVAQFNEQGRQLDDIATGLDQRIGTAVTEIGSLARQIAELNTRIVHALGRSQGAPPNDLLDQRDGLLNRLSELTRIQTMVQDDGAVNVLIGNGQTLVAGSTAMSLAMVVDPIDASRMQIAYTVAGVQSIVSDQLGGGELGGLLDFRSQVLDPARNGVGRVAVGLALAFNAVHRMGMDLNGQPGGDIFDAPVPALLPASGNTGTLQAAYDPNAIGALTAADYTLQYNAGAYTLTRLTDGATQTLSGAGPFAVDGMIITVTGAPANGDRYLLQPTRTAARGVGLALSDPRALAAAAPIRGSTAAANIGTATVSAGEVLDPANPALLTPITLVFANPPTGYQINGAGPVLPYTSGANIDLNGWRVQVSGIPAAGDSFGVGPNNGGVGDNRNVLRLNAISGTRIFDTGTATLLQAHATVVARIGSQAKQAEVAVTAMTALNENVTEARSQVSGVNLDEEAANLIRYQQAYQAAAKVITTAQEAFDALLQALR